MYTIIEKLNISTLEEVNIFNKLIEAGLSKEMIRIDQISPEIDSYTITKFHYCDLLESLFSSVILYLGGSKEILFVEISMQNNLCIMKFIYKRDFVYESLQAINFINCNAWALVSNAAMNINFGEDNSILLLQI